MDGSQKLPQRWLQGALARLGTGAEVPCTVLGVAAWIRYTLGVDLHGYVYAVDDPMASRFALLHDAHNADHEALVQAFSSSIPCFLRHWPSIPASLSR